MGVYSPVARLSCPAVLFHVQPSCPCFGYSPRVRLRVQISCSVSCPVFVSIFRVSPRVRLRVQLFCFVSSLRVHLSCAALASGSVSSCSVLFRVQSSCPSFVCSPRVRLRVQFLCSALGYFSNLYDVILIHFVCDPLTWFRYSSM